MFSSRRQTVCVCFHCMQSILQTGFLTNLFSGRIIHTISYAVQVPPGLPLEPAENSESGQNPERYRHCMRGGTARDESQSLGFFLRRQCGRLMIRESGDLLECVTCAFCVIMEWTVCLLWKNGHGSVMLPWLFRVHRRFADCRWQAVSVSLSVRGKSFAPFPLPHPGIGKQRPQKEEEIK